MRALVLLCAGGTEHVRECMIMIAIETLFDSNDRDGFSDTVLVGIKFDHGEVAVRFCHNSFLSQSLKKYQCLF